MQFKYTVETKDGKTQESSAEAPDKDTLLANLRKQGLRPLSVRVVTGFSASKKSAKRRVKSKDLVIFTRQLSTLVSAGVPLTRALTTLQTQTENKVFKSVVGDVIKDVEGGLSLGDTFAKYPSAFSEVYVNMVKAGEAGGILDEILKRLAHQLEQDASIRKKIKGAMTYPVVILSITIVAFFGIMTFIIPKIGKILNDLAGPGTKLPVYTRILLGISVFMQHYLIFILILLGIAGFFARRYIRTEAGKYQFHSLLLKIPVLREVITKVAVARFARTFAALMSAGVSVLDSLEVTGGAIGNKVIEKELKDAAKDVKNGSPLSQPIAKSKHFPQIVSQMLAVGEETGQLDTILVKVADFYEEEVNVFIDSLSSIIEPLMILVLGTLVGIIAASVMGPIAGLSKNIGSN
jgi:type IV pilus assembly protein PilC